jgi:uncharacterized protein Smg (DUF494 family)
MDAIDIKNQRIYIPDELTDADRSRLEFMRFLYQRKRIGQDDDHSVLSRAESVPPDARPKPPYTGKAS